MDKRVMAAGALWSRIALNHLDLLVEQVVCRPLRTVERAATCYTDGYG